MFFTLPFFLVLFLAIGDIVSEKTKAFVPSILIFLILLLIATWSGFLPKDVISLGGFSNDLVDVIIVVIVVNMGSSLCYSDLKNEWKTVIVGVMSIVGCAATLLTIGAGIYGWNYAVVAAPPITGGLVAAFEMSKAAIAKNLPVLSAIALLILSLQSIPAYLIIPTLLKRECKNRLALRSSLSTTTTAAFSPESKKNRIPSLSTTFNSTAVHLALLAGVGLLAVLSSQVSTALLQMLGIQFSISPTIFGLFYGVVAGEIGLLEPKSLQKANVFGFFLIGSIVGVMGGLVNSSPEEIFSVLAPIAGMIIIGLVGICILSILVGRFLRLSWELSFCIGLNCLLGFPLNFLLSTEAIHAVTKNEDEKDYLSNSIIPTMLVAGFVTCTIGSVVFAGILKNFL